MYCENTRETLLAAGEMNGLPLNYASLGRCLDVSSREARRRIEALENNGLILLLPPFEEGKIKERLRRPRLYLRDVDQTRRLAPDVKRNLRETYELLIEKIMAQERLRHKESWYYHYTGCSGYGVELIIERREYRIGIVFNLSDSFLRSTHRSLRCAVKEGTNQRGFALHIDCQAFFNGRFVLAVPFSSFIAAYEHWSEERCGNNDLRILLRWVNSATAVSFSSNTG